MTAHLYTGTCYDCGKTPFQDVLGSPPRYVCVHCGRPLHITAREEPPADSLQEPSNPGSST